MRERSASGQERHFGNAKTLYDNVAWKNHHDHLICTQCGRIIEFENRKIELLQEKVARENRFSIVNHKLELYGICGRCRRRDSRSSPLDAPLGRGRGGGAKVFGSGSAR